jgi:hypothetical protein
VCEEEPTADLDDLDDEQLDPINHPEDPDYVSRSEEAEVEKTWSN